MNKYSPFLLTAALLLLAPYLLAADLMENLQSRLKTVAVLHMNYQQTRQIAALKKPLISSGQLIVVRGKGLAWIAEKPYAITYILGREQVVEIRPGATPQLKSAASVPGITQFSAVLNQLFSGNLDPLHSQFTLQQLPASDGAWQLSLTPKSTEVAKVLASIELAGHDWIERLVIREANGDQTRLVFSQVNSTAELKPTEQAWFGLLQE